MTRARTRSGFTLIEMMVVIVIIGILATVLVTQIAGKTDRAKASTSRAKIEQIAAAVEEFRMDHNKYPDSLVDLFRMPSYIDAGKWPTGGYVRKDPSKDSWDQDLIYNVPGTGGQPFDLVSWGADQLQGGEGNNADIWNHDAWQQ